MLFEGIGSSSKPLGFRSTDIGLPDAPDSEISVRGVEGVGVAKSLLCAEPESDSLVPALSDDLGSVENVVAPDIGETMEVEDNERKFTVSDAHIRRSFVLTKLRVNLISTIVFIHSYRYLHEVHLDIQFIVSYEVL